jgi:rubrerythrin
MQFISAGDVLRYAVKQEEASASYYEYAADAVKDTEIKTIFRNFATEELKHKQYLIDYELGQNAGFESLTYSINQ